jgi:hypothetical protein
MHHALFFSLTLLLPLIINGSILDRLNLTSSDEATTNSDSALTSMKPGNTTGTTPKRLVMGAPLVDFINKQRKKFVVSFTLDSVVLMDIQCVPSIKTHKKFI